MIFSVNSPIPAACGFDGKKKGESRGCSAGDHHNGIVPCGHCFLHQPEATGLLPHRLRDVDHVFTDRSSCCSRLLRREFEWGFRKHRHTGSVVEFLVHSCHCVDARRMVVAEKTTIHDYRCDKENNRRRGRRRVAWRLLPKQLPFSPRPTLRRAIGGILILTAFLLAISLKFS